jgi:hypothetical protein
LILANSLKWAAHAFIMLFLLRRRVGSLQDAQIWIVTLKAGAASLLMGGGVYALVSQLGRFVPAGLLGEVVLVGAGGLSGGLMYVALAKLLRLEEIDLLAQVFGDWLRLLTGSGR